MKYGYNQIAYEKGECYFFFPSKLCNLGIFLWYKKLLNSCTMKISRSVLHVKHSSFSEHFYYFDSPTDGTHSHPELLGYYTFRIKLQTH